MSDVRFLLQICHAYKDVGGTTIVILTETPKLEIQAWFRCVPLHFIACSGQLVSCWVEAAAGFRADASGVCCRTMLEDQTLGSTLVFRQGNPLILSDLHSVNAYYAASTVILGDQSRYGEPPATSPRPPHA